MEAGLAGTEWGGTMSKQGGCAKWRGVQEQEM